MTANNNSPIFYDRMMEKWLGKRTLNGAEVLGVVFIPRQVAVYQYAAVDALYGMIDIKQAARDVSMAMDALDDAGQINEDDPVMIFTHDDLEILALNDDLVQMILFCKPDPLAARIKELQLAFDVYNPTHDDPPFSLS
ncbi:MAG: hypothetical protein RLP44_15965 [Aggregatilineales bacterium]